VSDRRMSPARKTSADPDALEQALMEVKKVVV
jgi:hypothetical protein